MVSTPGQPSGVTLQVEEWNPLFCLLEVKDGRGEISRHRRTRQGDEHKHGQALRRLSHQTGWQSQGYGEHQGVVCEYRHPPP
jgi:hypothetical protein